MAPGDAPERWPSRATVGAILAGGESARFGGIPKGLERVDGVRMIDRVAAALRDATRDLLVVANDPEATGWLPGTRVVADVVPKAGPLGGVHAALNAHVGRGVLVVAWDMPFVTAALLRAIVARGEGGEAVVVPEARAGRPEPACAYYPPASRLALERFLAEGGRRPRRFLEEYGRVVQLGPADLVAFGDPGRLLASVNSRAELDEVERGTGRRGDQGRKRPSPPG